MTKSVAYSLIISIIANLAGIPALGAEREQKLGIDFFQSEYVVRNTADDILMQIQVLGAVNRPGMYRVPLNTDLIMLIAYAGGTSANADISSIQINHRDRAKVSEFNLEKMVSSTGITLPTLTANDVVLVKQKTPLVSSDILTTVALISGVVGIVLSGFLISRESQR